MGWLFGSLNVIYSSEKQPWELQLCKDDLKNWLIGKDPDAGKDWGQEEKGVTEDEMVGWHHQLNEHDFEQAPGDSDRWASLVHCSPLGHKESDMTEELNNKDDVKQRDS